MSNPLNSTATGQPTPIRTLDELLTESYPHDDFGDQGALDADLRRHAEAAKRERTALQCPEGLSAESDR